MTANRDSRVPIHHVDFVPVGPEMSLRRPAIKARPPDKSAYTECFQ